MPRLADIFKLKRHIVSIFYELGIRTYTKDFLFFIEGLEDLSQMWISPVEIPKI